MTDAQCRISEIIRRRADAGLTIYALAKAAGVKWETLRDLEHGRRRPKHRTLRRLETALMSLPAAAAPAGR